MVKLFVAAILVGLCASLTLRVVPFVLLLSAMVGLWICLLLIDGRSGALGPAIFMTVLCFAIAQAGYVVGLVVQSFVGYGSPKERCIGLMGSLRRLIFQRK